MTPHELEVFYDGDCPLCMREIRFLMRRDASRARILFTDIASPTFDATSLGLTHAQLMERIRGRLPNGTIIEGVEVLRHLYSAVGFGWLVALSRAPIVSKLLAVGYHLFAKDRLRLTGRLRDRGLRRLGPNRGLSRAMHFASASATLPPCEPCR